MHQEYPVGDWPKVFMLPTREVFSFNLDRIISLEEMYSHSACSNRGVLNDTLTTLQDDDVWFVNRQLLND